MVLSPLVSSMKEVNIVVHLPLLNPKMENTDRHYLESEVAPQTTIARRIRQRQHGCVNGHGHLFVNEKLDFPILKVGEFGEFLDEGRGLKDLGVEELQAMERKMWKAGLDVEDEFLSGGVHHCPGGFEWEDHVERNIMEREKQLGRSLKWTGSE